MLNLAQTSHNSDFQTELFKTVQSAVQAVMSDQKKNQIQSEILRPIQAQQLINCSRSHLDHLSETDPTFPKKISLGNRWTGYRRVDLMAWIESKAQGVI
ncbi:MAG: hypothetical protein ISEC1_P1591 [Thiomicrorhabdus sp.]|nr:MAG: hypothetical protein ISEC1_P1591 [Thiomicrorhabdus sp.]